jgi:cell division protein FtsB
MKWLATMLGVALLMLQYRIWLSPEGMRNVWQLRTTMHAQQDQNEALSERNRQLAAEVRDLKKGYAALEERARNDLGMIGSNETFYQVLPAAAASSAVGTAPATGPAAPIRTAAR